MQDIVNRDICNNSEVAGVMWCDPGDSTFGWKDFVMHNREQPGGINVLRHDKSPFVVEFEGG